MLNSYLLVKTLHIVCSVLLVGTGFGSALYLFWANRSGSVPAQALITRLVVRADAWITTPAVLIQPATGLWLARQAGWPLDSTWLGGALLLYAVAGLCWLPVLWLQWQMMRLAEQAMREAKPLPSRYWRHACIWEWLGYPAFAAMLLIYFLMVFKPA